MGNVERRALPALSIEFAGERHPVPAAPGFSIGRAGDLVIDDNPHLHRRFLVVHAEHGMWWIRNVGSHLSATVSDRELTVRASLAPGGRLPVLADILDVVFTAGRTEYGFALVTYGSLTPTAVAPGLGVGETTAGRVVLNEAQRLLLVVLAEDALRRASAGPGEIPTTAVAAARLGWTLPSFTRRLDHLCVKLERAGVRGLRADAGGMSTHRRRRLVEHALATRLVSRADLALLDRVTPPRG